MASRSADCSLLFRAPASFPSPSRPPPLDTSGGQGQLRRASRGGLTRPRGAGPSPPYFFMTELPEHHPSWRPQEVIHQAVRQLAHPHSHSKAAHPILAHGWNRGLVDVTGLDQLQPAWTGGAPGGGYEIRLLLSPSNGAGVGPLCPKAMGTAGGQGRLPLALGPMSPTPALE